MQTVTLDQFFEQTGILRLGVRDHHFTGPRNCQQAEGHGSLYHAEGFLLASICYHYSDRPVIEIGADLGISTRYIHEALDQANEGLVLSVDIQHFWQADPAWSRRLRLVQDSQTVSQNPIAQKLAPFGVAYIDGNHHRSFILGDIRETLALGARVLVFHDCAPNCPAGDPGGRIGSDARACALETFRDSAKRIYDVTTPAGVMVVFLDD